MTDAPERIWATDSMAKQLSEPYQNVMRETATQYTRTDVAQARITDLEDKNRELAMQYIAAQGQAEELQAKLELAVEALEFVDEKTCWEINPSNYDHQQVCDMNADWCELGNLVIATLADIKGEG